MSEQKTDNNELSKFKVNEASIAGVIISVRENKTKSSCNVTIMVNDDKGVNAKPKFINAYISGEERNKNFMASYNEAKSNDLGLNLKGQQYQPCAHLTGTAYFSTNEVNGVKNQQVSIIVSGKCLENDEKFQITKTKEELNSFRSEFDNTNPKVNQVEIRADIATDVTRIPTKSGNNLTKFNIKHNYMQNDEKKTSYASVMVPPGMQSELKAVQPEKGVPIQMTAKIQPATYQNKNGETVNTFTLVAKSLNRDFAQTVSQSKANKAIDKVAEISKKTDRLKEATTQKADLKEKGAKPEVKKQQTR